MLQMENCSLRAKLGENKQTYVSSVRGPEPVGGAPIPVTLRLGIMKVQHTAT